MLNCLGLGSVVITSITPLHTQFNPLGAFRQVLFNFSLYFHTQWVDNHLMPPKTQFSIRLSAELVDAIDSLASEQVRDRTSMIEYILTLYVRDNPPKLADKKPN